MAMPSDTSVWQRGETIYQTRLRRALEPTYNGCFVVINTRTHNFSIVRSEGHAIEAVQRNRVLYARSIPNEWADWKYDVFIAGKYGGERY